MTHSACVEKKICWVSVVGHDPSVGGGVATAVQTLKESDIFTGIADYYSLSGLSVFKQILLFLRLVYICRYRYFVVHSFFSPFSLMLLLIPFKARVVIFPHGELKKEALEISRKKKVFAYSTVRVLSFLIKLTKKVSVISSGKEENNFLSDIVSINLTAVLPDLVSNKTLFTFPRAISSNEKINLIFIARMVPNKGISFFLKLFLEDILNEKPSSFSEKINSINIYYFREDEAEYQMVLDGKEKIENKAGIRVNLYENLSRDNIKSRLQQIENKMAFLSSQFESFSYALLESLGFEYCPYVWFENELVQELELEGLCIKGSYGVLPDSENLDGWLMPTDFNQVKAFLLRKNLSTTILYKSELRKMLGDVFFN
ncbi:hypothetical protein C0J08_03680 [Marinomonas sp. CT5]|uniref:hypothetical protein n=1 Tax=Marinomonas sp. CT5 TaxID=2066133 RepID=UPI001BAECF49|nr:hypothetical protein [Marinomonas sp. CT5]QUX94566.1 hypothetical protein C0J08_03680 [Marinomonas sp. CT5]